SDRGWRTEWSDGGLSLARHQLSFDREGTAPWRRRSERTVAVSMVRDGISLRRRTGARRVVPRDRDDDLSHQERGQRHHQRQARREILGRRLSRRSVAGEREKQLRKVS